MNKWIVAVALVLMSCSLVMAKDVTIKGIPDEIADKQIYEWVSVLIERAENQKVNQIEAVKTAVTTAEANIDTFRKANTLTAKFEKPKEVEEVKEL